MSYKSYSVDNNEQNILSESSKKPSFSVYTFGLWLNGWRLYSVTNTYVLLCEKTIPKCNILKILATLQWDKTGRYNNSKSCYSRSSNTLCIIIYGTPSASVKVNVLCYSRTAMQCAWNRVPFQRTSFPRQQQLGSLNRGNNNNVHCCCLLVPRLAAARGRGARCALPQLLLLLLPLLLCSFVQQTW